MKLTARDFPPGTPLNHFFAWNETARRPDRRFKLARDPDRLPASPAAKRLAERLAAAIGNRDMAAHAAVFAAFEELDPPHAGPRRILVIRLSAFGDFIQSLGPMAAIRRHNQGDRISLLTTRPLAGFAQELGLFDEVVVDERPGPLALPGWLAAGCGRAVSIGSMICKPRRGPTCTPGCCGPACRNGRGSPGAARTRTPIANATVTTRSTNRPSSC